MGQNKNLWRFFFFFILQAASEIYGVGKSIEAFFETLIQTYLPCYVDFIHRDIPSPTGSTGSLEPNGDAPRTKKRRSPAPDANRNSPLHISWFLVLYRSVSVVKLLALQSLAHVLGSNPAGDRIKLLAALRFIAQSFTLSPVYYLYMT